MTGCHFVRVVFHCALLGGGDKGKCSRWATRTRFFGIQAALPTHQGEIQRQSQIVQSLSVRVTKEIKLNQCPPSPSKTQHPPISATRQRPHRQYNVQVAVHSVPKMWMQAVLPIPMQLRQLPRSPPRARTLLQQRNHHLQTRQLRWSIRREAFGR